MQVLLGLAGVFVLLFVAPVFGFVLWLLAGGNDYLEGSRVRSPDGKLDAIFALVEARRQPLAATIPFRREVYIQKAGAKLTDQTAREGYVFSDDAIDVQGLRWLASDKLLVLLDGKPEKGSFEPMVKVVDGARRRTVTVSFKVERGASAAPTATP
jgi:hypothetical protein